MSNHTCIHCGRVLESGEEYIFDEEHYCKDCLDEVTTTCDCCGRRIYTENDEGDSYRSLCDRCYRDFYTACDRCGRLVRNEDAYYLDEEDDTPYCHSCYACVNLCNDNTIEFRMCRMLYLVLHC